MNWDAISFDWNHIRAFLATVEHGSLSGAARALGQTQPTLSRQISSLEAALQLTLFERGTRVIELTEAGTELLTHVRTMTEAATQISRVATGQSQSVEGTVRITCSDAMAAYSLPKITVDLQRTHPGICIELVPSNEMSSLTKREADIAIRHVRPEQPDLIAKRLSDIEVALFASQSLLDKIGPIETAEDLSEAPFVGFEQPERLIPQLTSLGIPVDEKNFRVVTTSGSVMYELTREGAGIAILPTIVSESRLGLKRVLPEAPTFSVPIWLVTHREIGTSRRIRIVFDQLAKDLGKNEWSSLIART